MPIQYHLIGEVIRTSRCVGLFGHPYQPPFHHHKSGLSAMLGLTKLRLRTIKQLWLYIPQIPMFRLRQPPPSRSFTRALRQATTESPIQSTTAVSNLSVTESSPRPTIIRHKSPPIALPPSLCVRDEPMDVESSELATPNSHHSASGSTPEIVVDSSHSFSPSHSSRSLPLPAPDSSIRSHLSCSPHTHTHENTMNTLSIASSSSMTQENPAELSRSAKRSRRKADRKFHNAEMLRMHRFRKPSKNPYMSVMNSGTIIAQNSTFNGIKAALLRKKARLQLAAQISDMSLLPHNFSLTFAGVDDLSATNEVCGHSMPLVLPDVQLTHSFASGMQPQIIPVPAAAIAKPFAENAEASPSTLPDSVTSILTPEFMVRFQQNKELSRSLYRQNHFL